MPDYHAHIEEQFAWLLSMARNPATKAHAWHRAKELAADESGLYAGMDRRLAEAMQSESPPPSEQAAGRTTESTGESRPCA